MSRPLPRIACAVLLSVSLVAGLAFSLSPTAAQADDSPASAVDRPAAEKATGLLAIVVAGRTTPLTPDARIIDRLEGLGFTTRLVDDDDLGSADLEGADLFVVTSSVIPKTVDDALAYTSAPVLTTEAYLANAFGLSAAGNEDVVATRLDIEDVGHELVQDLPRRVTVQTEPMPMAVRYRAEPATTVLARANGRPAWIASEAGTIAPGRRVGFFFSYRGPLRATRDAWAMFDASVAWLTDGQDSGGTQPAPPDPAPEPEPAPAPPSGDSGFVVTVTGAAVELGDRVAEIELASDGDDLDPASIDVVEVDRDGDVIDAEVVHQFDPATASGAADELLILVTSARQATERHYLVTSSTAKEDSFDGFPLVSFREATTTWGNDSYEIFTPRGTWTFDRDGGGFSSLIDTDGREWIGYGQASESAGEWRGVPNATYRQNLFHAGFANMTTRLVNSGPLRMTLLVVSKDLGWRAEWDVFPTHARMTMLRAPASWWFQYEGTPGGELEPTIDYSVRSNGSVATLDTEWSGDLGAEEWVAFVDPRVGRGLYVASTGDDELPEMYQPLGEMTVFAFGRAGLQPTPLLTGADQTFTVGLTDGLSHEQIAPEVRASIDPSREQAEWPAVDPTPTPAPEPDPTPEPQPTPEPTPTEPASPALVEYRFDEGTGTTVRNRGTLGGQLDLAINDPANVRWRSGSLELVRPTVLSSSSAGRVLTAALQTGREFSVELVIDPANLTQNGPARILSVSGSPYERNLTVGQGVYNAQSNRIETRLRTSTSNANGFPRVTTPAGSLTGGKDHIVYSRARDGQVTVWVNGRVEGSGTVSGSAAGDLSTWDPNFPLLIGNEVTRDRPWLGTLDHVAIRGEAADNASVCEGLALHTDRTCAGPPAPPEPAPTPAPAPPPASGGTSGPVNFTKLSSTTGDLPVPGPQRSDSRPQEQTASLVGDLSGDGIDDFVIASRLAPGPSIVWYERTASGWKVRTVEPDVLNIEAGGAVHDIDGDGDLDIAFGGDSQSRQIWWWENPGADKNASRWVRRTIKDGGGRQHHDMAFGDVDGDGEAELVYWNQKPRPGGDGLFVSEIPANPRSGGLWFTTRVFSGSAPSEGLTLADINLDGKLDIVGAGYWFRHDGGTRFTARTIDASMTFTRVEVGQFIEGGRPEVVFDSGDDSGPLRIYHWTGSAWARTDLIDKPSHHGHSLRVGDINGDGHLDLLSAEMTLADNPGAETRVFYGDGSGNFDQHLVVDGLDNHESQLADLDGDGDLDILVKPYNQDTRSVHVLRNDGGAGSSTVGLDDWDRQVIEASQPLLSLFVVPGDLDGDGDDDLIAGRAWYRNPGRSGQAWQRTNFALPMRNASLVADLDGDGDLDVLGTQGASTGQNPKLVWARNDGSSFKVLTNIAYPANGDFLQGAAMLDLGGGRKGVVLSWHNGRPGTSLLTIPDAPSSQTWSLSQLSATTNKEEVAVADIDGDGDEDVSLGNVWLRNDGGWFRPVTVADLGSLEPDRVRLGDLDGDGDLDAVIGFEFRSTDSLIWLEQPANASGQWTRHVIASHNNPMSLDVSDMDGDGDLDVVAGAHNKNAPTTSKLTVYENLGQGANWSGHLVHEGDEHHDGAQVADFDGDGDLDIASIGLTHPRVLVYWNNSGESAGSTTTIATPPTSDPTGPIGDPIVNGDQWHLVEMQELTSTTRRYAVPTLTPPPTGNWRLVGNSRLLLRFQVTDKPSSMPMAIQFCAWRHGATRYQYETCSSFRELTITGEGVYYADYGRVADWWKKNGDFSWSTPPDVVRFMPKVQLDLIGGGYLPMVSSCGTYCYRGDDIDQHMPFSFRAEVIAVDPDADAQLPVHWLGAPSGW